MSLVTVYGRFNRLAIVTRAQAIQRAAGRNWQDAMAQAWREAKAEFAALHRPALRQLPSIAIASPNATTGAAP
jgi:kynureninase